eukprot:gnl/MRDRNA2_/MRDRNA2_28226_c0_seq1.p1 gnl/MRDRNA2_/MRDRNA2_28226_c0~~gnl/MRDRNA2_/MRDRNA2_28226_c0_seq1.p1  ORF type:complete len:876 (-),score=197.78 gnl/MRDRNA2_/MRDRNA2_28226_c0_seq1:8-2545(-)
MQAQITKLKEDMSGTHQVVKALVEANTGNLKALATRLDIIAQHLKNQTGFTDPALVKRVDVIQKTLRFWLKKEKESLKWKFLITDVVAKLEDRVKNTEDAVMILSKGFSQLGSTGQNITSAQAMRTVAGPPPAYTPSANPPAYQTTTTPAPPAYQETKKVWTPSTGTVNVSTGTSVTGAPTITSAPPPPYPAPPATPPPYEALPPVGAPPPYSAASPSAGPPPYVALKVRRKEDTSVRNPSQETVDGKSDLQEAQEAKEMLEQEFGPGFGAGGQEIEADEMAMQEAMEKEMENKMEARLQAMEQKMQKNVEAKVEADVEAKLEMQLKSAQSGAAAHNVVSGSLESEIASAVENKLRPLEKKVDTAIKNERFLARSVARPSALAIETQEAPFDLPMDLRIAFSHPVRANPKGSLFIRLKGSGNDVTPGDEIPINVRDSAHVKFDKSGLILHLDQDLRLRSGESYSVSVDKNAIVGGNSTALAADVRVLNGFQFVVANSGGYEVAKAHAPVARVPHAAIAVGRRSATMNATFKPSVVPAQAAAAAVQRPFLMKGPNTEAVKYDKASITLQFSKPVEAGFGSFYLTPAAPAKDGGGLHGATMVVVAVNDKSQVQIDHGVVTITPSMSLAPATPYTVNMDEYALHSAGARLPVQVSPTDMQFVTSFLEDCLVSPWSSWSPCPTTCSPNGQQSRFRVITRDAKAGCSKHLEDTRACPMPAACENVKAAEGNPSEVAMPQAMQFSSLGASAAVAVDEPATGQDVVNITPEIVTPLGAGVPQATLGITPEIVTAQVGNQMPALTANPQIHAPVGGTPKIPPGMRIVATAPGVVNLNTDAKFMQMSAPMPGGM